MVVSLGLMGVDHFTPVTSTLRQALLQVLQPIEYMATIPDTLYRALLTVTHPDERERLLERLQTENRLLKANLLKMHDLELENQRLRQLLDASSQLPPEYNQFIIATVLRANIRNDRNELVLNKGTAEGIVRHLPVLDTRGVLGLVTDTATFTSRVRLLTDPSMEIPVRVERTGQRAITRGLGHGRLEVNFIRQGADIRKGDRLITSGLGEIYPSGYPVAEVVKVHQDSGATFLTISAIPLSQLYNNHEVLILKHEKSPPHP